jgi:O-antigen ligase/polysaccharide polymerase Wzy-like membrane protein
LISARDMAIAAGVPPAIPRANAAPLAERILLLVLFVTVLTSSVAFIEPSPNDLLMGALALTCLAAGVRFQRMFVVPLIFLVIWNFAGTMALIPVVGQEKTIQYTGTSAYLAIAALVFACLFSSNSMSRLATMRVAYTLSAIMVAFAGISGYFGLFPGAEQLFAPFGRALGSFKDPNVFGPFLIWPTLFIVYRMITRHIGLSDLMVSAILLFALLLSFSRGAWFHFAASSLVLVGLAFLTAPNQYIRLRVVVLAVLSLLALAGLLALLLSFDSIGAMFRERAQLIQSYDVGEGGRFRLQELALASVLNFPNGMGPFEFARVHGLQQHNVYLQAFLVYGWGGAMAYLLLLLSTLWVGLRSAFMRTPWQAYAITAYATFVGEVAEGFVIDTDHWRHFYLLLGMIWGLAAATFRPQVQMQSAGWAAGATR